MSKMFKEDKFTKLFMKKAEDERRLVASQLGKFYPDGTLADFTQTASDDNPFKAIFSTLRNDSQLQSMTEKQMLESCYVIRERVKEKQPGHTEINFRKRVQKVNGNEYPLGSTVIRIRAMSGDTPVFIYLEGKDSLNSIVFIGGDSAEAFIVTQDEDENDCVVRLEEFCSLSISENSKPGDEIAIMTNFYWTFAQVNVEIIAGNSLDPIKSLLLAVVFKNKDAERQKPAGIEKGSVESE